MYLTPCFFTVWHLQKVPLTFPSLSALFSLPSFFYYRLSYWPEKKKTLSFEKQICIAFIFSLILSPFLLPLWNTVILMKHIAGSSRQHWQYTALCVLSHLFPALQTSTDLTAGTSLLHNSDLGGKKGKERNMWKHAWEESKILRGKKKRQCGSVPNPS